MIKYKKELKKIPAFFFKFPFDVISTFLGESRGGRKENLTECGNPDRNDV
jgi:hypothetical protein